MTTTAPTRSHSRSLRSIASWVLLLAFVALWATFLRPQFLGGPATFVGVSGISMQPTMHDGDLAFVSRRAAYRAGDVVAYRIPRGQPGAGNNIIHRVTGGDGDRGFVTRGDHNSWDDIWRPTERDVLGKVVLRLPGVAKLFGQLREPSVLAPFAGVLAFAAVLWAWRRDPEPDSLVEAPPVAPLTARSLGLTVTVLATASALALLPALARGGRRR